MCALWVLRRMEVHQRGRDRGGGGGGSDFQNVHKSVHVHGMGGGRGVAKITFVADPRISKNIATVVFLFVLLPLSPTPFNFLSVSNKTESIFRS